MSNMVEFNAALHTQEVFINVMNAFSHPLRVYNIKLEGFNPLTRGDNRIVEELCAVFMDNSTRFYVHGDNKLAEDIRELTYARPSNVETADYVIINNLSEFDMWEKINPGTLVNPHKGATVFIQAPRIEGEIKVLAQGPGIDGKAAFLLDRAIADCLEKLSALNIEYPMGMEILFFTEHGDICAVSRHILQIQFETGETKAQKPHASSGFVTQVKPISNGIAKNTNREVLS